MFSYSEPKEGSYIVLTPKFDYDDVRKINFNGIKTTENDTYFDMYLSINSVERAAKYDEAVRKFVDINVEPGKIARVRLLKQETEYYGKKKVPSLFDTFFIEQIKAQCDDKGVACINGTLDMSKSMIAFIEKINSSDNEERKKMYLDEVIDTALIPELPKELEEFTTPEIKTSSGKSSYSSGKSYGQKEAERLQDRIDVATKLMNIVDENKLYEQVSNYAILQTDYSPEDKNYEEGLKSFTHALYYEIVKAILAK